MPEMLILCGLPGSGKSDYAKRWVAEDPSNRFRINYDDLRDTLYGEFWKWNRKEEDAMKVYAREGAIGALTEGKSVVIDNCNLNDNARKPWMDLAKSFGITAEIFEIDTPIEECIRRDSARHGKDRVGRAVIERMALFGGFIDWNDTRKYPRDFIIVDMDGTIADCDARRKKAFQGPTKHKDIMLTGGPEIRRPCPLDGVVMDRQCPECGGVAYKNWGIFYDGCEDDPVIEPILDLVCRLSNDGLDLSEGYDVIIASGRPTDAAGKGTEAWLDKNQVPYRHLFMRNGGDSRHDYIVKQEILDLLPKDRIKYVFDDRQQVVDMWRANGLTCLQVADGKF